MGHMILVITIWNVEIDTNAPILEWLSILAIRASTTTIRVR